MNDDADIIASIRPSRRNWYLVIVCGGMRPSTPGQENAVISKHGSENTFWARLGPNLVSKSAGRHFRFCSSTVAYSYMYGCSPICEAENLHLNYRIEPLKRLTDTLSINLESCLPTIISQASIPPAMSTGDGCKHYSYPGMGEWARKTMAYSQAIRVENRIVCSGQGVLRRSK